MATTGTTTGAALARAHLYDLSGDPFVLPPGLSDAEVAEAQRVALHYAAYHENAPWLAGGDLDHADEILAVTSAALRLRRPR